MSPKPYASAVPITANLQRMALATGENDEPPVLWRQDQVPVTLRYTNHRGETSIRHITPILVEFDASEWHAAPQWLLHCYDHSKRAYRTFSLKDCDFVAG